MKKLLSKLVFIVAMLSPLNTVAYNFMVDGIAYNKNSDGTSVTVTFKYNPATNNYSYTGLHDVIIPDTVTYDGITYSVTKIGDNAFNKASSITSIIISNSVTSIGKYAFASCSKLASIILPNSLDKIAENTFSGCVALTNISIPNFVTDIAQNAFSNCSNLSSISFGNSLKSIGNNAFTSCISLNNVVLPDSLISIGDNAFFQCSGLESLTMGDLVTTIGYKAFSQSGLISLTFGESVTTLGQYVCENCEDLVTLTFHKNITTIGDGSFRNTHSLRHVYAFFSDPPNILKTVFANSDNSTVAGYYNSAENSILHVPNGTALYYSSRVGWKDFTIIEDLDDWITPQANSLSLDTDEITLFIGEKQKLNAIVEPENAQQTLNWTSSRPNIATVSDDGSISALNEGYTIIIVSTIDGSNLIASCLVTVKEPYILSTQSVSAPVNTLRNIPITIDNHADVESFALTVSIPDSIRFIQDALPASRCNDFNVTTIYNADSTVMHIEGTKTLNSMENGSGPFVLLPIKSSKYIDDFEIRLDDISFTSTNPDVGTRHLDSVNVLMRVLNLGDVNGDKKVDVNDATHLISFALGNTDYLLNFGVSDMNNDGVIDVSDITMLINLILGYWIE